MSETRCTCGAGHKTFGECIRNKGITIGYCGQGGGDATSQKKWDREITAYYDTVKQGIEPAGTSMRQIRQAVEISNKTGVAFDASAR